MERENESATVAALLENYRIWAPDFRFAKYDPQIESSTLFDALAVAIVYQQVGIDSERSLALSVLLGFVLLANGLLGAYNYAQRLCEAIAYQVRLLN